ncbi:MAG: sigma-54-dependent transcriptional regulator [Spirochaetota bacterium]
MDICIVDDVVENGRLIRRVLSNYATSLFADPHEALEHMRSHEVDILVTDQKMPGMTGLELIRRVRSIKPDVVAIVVSAFTERDDLIEAVNAQLVFRYLVKPFSVQELRDSVASAAARLERRRTEARMSSELAIQNRILLEENDTLRAGSQPILDLFAGGDPAMARIKELAMLYALSDEPVLITGETGTGKELLARIVHHFSPRRDKPFVAVNCSNLNEHLLESTLFGHARGAFTGAERDKQGLVQDAHEGTLFLDEIGDLPTHLQPKILRFIQFRTFTPVGATGERCVDVRIVSATNQNLRTMTEGGAFRTDLYYRLNTFQIHLPPLRQRRLDIVPIMRRIARARGSELPPVTDDAREFLEQHDFPGNVRELQNVVQRLLLLVHQNEVRAVTRAVLEQALAAATHRHREANGEIAIPRPAPGEQIDLRSVLRDVEQELIREVHAQEDGNISRSARRLGLSRQGLRNKLQAMDEPDEVEDLRDDA